MASGKRLLVNFDFDGVLVDSLDHLFHLVCETYRDTGIGRQPELSDFTEARELRFNGLANLAAVNAESRQQFAEHFYRLHRAANVSLSLFPGVAAMLEVLSGRHSLNVISAGREETVKRVLAAQNIHDVFDHIHGGNRGLSKAESLATLMDHYRNDPADTLMIGDAVSDITQGRRAGVRTIAVTWGYQSKAFLLSASPDYVVSTPGELCALIESLNV